jgi:uncharacterized protein (DUF302 family)
MKLKVTLAFVAGILLGTIAFGIFLRTQTPKLLFSVHESKYATVEQTSEALRKSIVDHGWQPCIVRDITDSMRDSGVSIEGDVHLVELCNPKYAKKVLSTHPEFSAIMPCQWGIYKGPDEKIYIATLNTRYIGQLLGGEIGKLLAQNIDIEEEWMLEGIVPN